MRMTELAIRRHRLLVRTMRAGASCARSSLARSLRGRGLSLPPSARRQAQLDAIAGSLDFILVTLATQEPVDFAKFFPLLRPRGTMCFVGMCPPITADVFTMGFAMNSITTSDSII